MKKKRTSVTTATAKRAVSNRSVGNTARRGIPPPGAHEGEARWLSASTLGQRAEDRQQEAGRYLHQGRYQGEGLCVASLTDEELVTLKAYMSGSRTGRAEAAAAGPVRRRPPAVAGQIRLPPARDQGLPPRRLHRPGRSRFAARCRCCPRRRTNPPPRKSRAEEVEAAEAAGKGTSGAGHEAGPRPARRCQPPAKPKSKEPAPQKPDIKLPPDAIRATAPAASRFPSTSASTRRRRPRTRRRPSGHRRGKRPAGEEKHVIPLPEAPLPGRERPRRAAAAPKDDEKKKPPRRWAAASSDN